jgi:hypothetical protein
MSVNILLTSLEEYLALKKDFLNGCGDKKTLNEAKKRFARALNEYIDWRTDGVLEDRRKRITNTNISVADLMTSNAEMSNLDSIVALNGAPTPPSKEITKTITDQRLKDWLTVYNNWYHTQRIKGIKSP